MQSLAEAVVDTCVRTLPGRRQQELLVLVVATVAGHDGARHPFRRAAAGARFRRLAAQHRHAVALALGAGAVGKAHRARGSQPSTLHELYPNAGIWLVDPLARARARALVADFHSGYGSLCSAMPMNIRARHPGNGMSPQVQVEINRLCCRWTDCRARFGGAVPVRRVPRRGRLLHAAGVALRHLRRGLEALYQQALLNTRSMRIWTQAALQKTAFVAMDEPYASPPSPSWPPPVNGAWNRPRRCGRRQRCRGSPARCATAATAPAGCARLVSARRSRRRRWRIRG